MLRHLKALGLTLGCIMLSASAIISVVLIEGFFQRFIPSFLLGGPTALFFSVVLMYLYFLNCCEV